MLWDLVEKQSLLVKGDPTQPQLLHGTAKFFTIISTQLQQLGVSRSMDACRIRWQNFERRTSTTKKADATQADATSLSFPHPGRPPPGREDYIESGTISFVVGQHRHQPAKKPRTMITQKSPIPQSAMPNVRNPSVTGNGRLTFNQITQNMAAGQIDRFDKGIQELQTTKEKLTTKIAEYEDLLETARLLPGLIQETQLEIEGLEKNIAAKENGKKALVTYLEVLESSEQL